MTNVVFLADHGVRRPGAAPHPALALAHQAAEGLDRLSDRIDLDAARAAFEAVLRDGPDIPERAVLEAAALAITAYEDARRRRPGRS